jgi:hypothetical protein
MALAVDAFSSGNAVSTDTLTFSHTCTGSDLHLRVGVSIWQVGSESVSSVTFNGAAMSLVPSGTADSGAARAELWYLINPDAVTGNVVITLTSAALGILGGAVSFTDAHQTTPNGTAVTATGSSTAPSVIASSASGELVQDVVTINNVGTLSVGTGQTARWNGTTGGGWADGGGSTEPGDASVTMNWSSTGSGVWAIVACPVRPTAVMSAGDSSNLLLLGVG